METLRRSTRPNPPPLPRAVFRQQEQQAAADFEATIGSLVQYYATLPPGVLEESLREQPPAELDAALNTTLEIRAPRRPRTWAWLLGGATSMILGGLTSFALIAGSFERPHVTQRPADEPPRIAVDRSAPADPTRGVPKAVPLTEAADEPLSTAAGAPGANASVQANEIVEHTAAAWMPARAVKRRAARPGGAAKGARVRRARPRNEAPTATEAPARSAPRNTDWEDPYK